MDNKYIVDPRKFFKPKPAKGGKDFLEFLDNLDLSETEIDDITLLWENKGKKWKKRFKKLVQLSKFPILFFQGIKGLFFKDQTDQKLNIKKLIKILSEKLDDDEFELDQDDLDSFSK